MTFSLMAWKFAKAIFAYFLSRLPKSMKAREIVLFPECLLKSPGIGLASSKYKSKRQSPSVTFHYIRFFYS